MPEIAENHVRPWLPVPGFEGYFVNSAGELRTTKYGRDKLLQKVRSPNHVLYVFRPAPQISRSVAVENILAEVFLGPCPPDHAAYVPPNWDETLAGVEYRRLEPTLWGMPSSVQWKPIPGTIGYWASESGQIWSAHVRRETKQNSRDDGGYAMVSLVRTDGRKRGIAVHRAVALAFLGLSPAGYVVDHIDGNKSNNAASNLRYVSHGENIAAAHRSGLVAPKNSGKKWVRVRLNKLREKLLSFGVPEAELPAAIATMQE